MIKNKGLCVCQNGSHQNCNTDQFGPIYPGETLFLSLYRQGYNYGSPKSLYYKFHKRSLETMCKSSLSTNVPLHHLTCANVNFTVWPSHSNWCEVFIQSPHFLYHTPFNVDFFYVLVVLKVLLSTAKSVNVIVSSNLLECSLATSMTELYYVLLTVG